MSERALIHLRKTALREGLPYQTLISSVLHKYINGLLVEREATRSSQRVLDSDSRLIEEPAGIVTSHISRMRLAGR